ncbi:hypothetical protein TNCV_3556831 [Trichonephila clavipes]|uniref:Uncharacterized protein n=1 Tax=Trichonephila clavipes TaxID=2585209 RepID=A0A8X7BI67_TRICX|nr:hypothetical protein TNCV_3556831 [Trichonephila clavipes]
MGHDLASQTDLVCCWLGIADLDKERLTNRFPSPNLVDVDDTLTEFNAEPSLWEALPEQDLTFDDYMLFDMDIAVWGALSDAEIVAFDHNNT